MARRMSGGTESSMVGGHRTERWAQLPLQQEIAVLVFKPTGACALTNPGAEGAALTLVMTLVMPVGVAGVSVAEAIWRAAVQSCLCCVAAIRQMNVCNCVESVGVHLHSVSAIGVLIVYGFSAPLQPLAVVSSMSWTPLRSFGAAWMASHTWKLPAGCYVWRRCTHSCRHPLHPLWQQSFLCSATNGKQCSSSGEGGGMSVVISGVLGLALAPAAMV